LVIAEACASSTAGCAGFGEAGEDRAGADPVGGFMDPHDRLGMCERTDRCLMTLSLAPAWRVPPNAGCGEGSVVHHVGVPDPIFARPRLAPLYDVLDEDRSDLAAYVGIVDELAASTVLDVGSSAHR
jgi:hypothetical protein